MYLRQTAPRLRALLLISAPPPLLNEILDKRPGAYLRKYGILEKRQCTFKALNFIHIFDQTTPGATRTPPQFALLSTSGFIPHLAVAADRYLGKISPGFLFFPRLSSEIADNF